MLVRPRLFTRFGLAGNLCAVRTLPSLPGLHDKLDFHERRYLVNWAHTAGNRSKAVVVHPRVRGDKEDLMFWDAAEGVALCKAMGWSIAGEDESEADTDAESEENSDIELEPDGKRQEDLWISEESVLRLDRVDSRFFFPVGELARLAVRMASTQSDILFVNTALTPVQQRNLEAAMDLVARAQRSQIGGGDRSEVMHVSVFDRPRVVLAIFARRATSPLAKMRIEMAAAQQANAKLGTASVKGVSAQLQRIADALVRSIPGCNSSALLARSGGAGGVSTSFNSSPQKTRQKQQRVFFEKDQHLREELAKSQTHRRQQRQGRQQLWTMGIVGYTNVGKSALVNRLSGSNLLVRNGVFVTLDVAHRRVLLPSGASCYVLDSVGFVKDLPHELYDAFSATVEELQIADVVLHVRDMSHPSREEHFDTVLEVLEKAGIDFDCVIEVWNKRDLLSDKEARHFRYIRGKSAKCQSTPVYMVSAINGDGFEELLQGLESKFGERSRRNL